ncbi:MAG: hypothetical protein KGQ41_08290 [Alphaproteobacteria bacterium]|nr:hypothetical protein [Alphaproteobacteria bacterium]
MKKLIPLSVLLILLGGFGAALFDHTFLKGRNASQTGDKPIEMRYRQLANGVMVYEEKPMDGDIQSIEPAAGADAQGAEPRFKYDPLTQTYRVQSVDRQGNKGQDIFSTPQ